MRHKIKQLFCKHHRVRCVHGNEFLSTTRPNKSPTHAYSRCMDCDKYLYNAMIPEICFFTKREHDWVNTGKNRRNKE